MVETVSAGESFVVKYLNRSYLGGPPIDVLRVNGDTSKGALGAIIMNANPIVNGVTGITITGFNTSVIAGANASVTPVSTVLAGAKVGDVVAGVIGLVGTAAFTDLSADFEKTISVAGHISQTLVNLSATTSIMVTLAHTS